MDQTLASRVHILSLSLCIAALGLLSADECRADSASAGRQTEEVLNRYYSLPQVIGGYSKMFDRRSGNTWFVVGEDHAATPQSTSAMYERLEALRFARDDYFILEEGRVFAPEDTLGDKLPRIGLESHDLYVVCLFQKIYFEQISLMTEPGNAEGFLAEKSYIDLFNKVIKLLKSKGWINENEHLDLTLENLIRVRDLIVSNTTSKESRLKPDLKDRISLFFSQSTSADLKLRFQERDHSFLGPIIRFNSQKTNSVFVVHVGEFHRRSLTFYLKEQGLEIEHFDADYFALNQLGFKIDFMLSMDSVTLTDKLNYDFLTSYLEKQKAWNDM